MRPPPRDDDSSHEEASTSPNAEKAGNSTEKARVEPLHVIARYRIDFVVDDVIVVEVKSTELLNPRARRQLMNCLKATPLEVGLLLHFGPEPKFQRVLASTEFRR